VRGAGLAVLEARAGRARVVIAYLGLLLVAERLRGQGLGRELMLEAARRTGLARLDLLSADDAVGFYERFDHKRKPGVRIYA
jgi:predicted N-acetyltransferase YhbS